MPITPSKIPGGNELINPHKLLAEAGIIEGMQVGDFGCGTRGYFSLQAARLVGSRGLVYAVDVLKSVLKGVESNAKLLDIHNIKTVWSDLEIPGATKVPAETLDFALLINILFQTKEDEKVVKEATRLLKPGGKFLICDWKKTNAPMGPRVEERITPAQVKEYAESAGLKLEKEFEAGTYHYALVFVK